jgi:sugar/nucleoside kinase (ribokinase family)
MTLTRTGIRTLVQDAPGTPLSLVLSGPNGGRQIHRDLKGTEALNVDAQAFRAALAGADVAVLTNVGWTRPLLPLAPGGGRAYRDRFTSNSRPRAPL